MVPNGADWALELPHAVKPTRGEPIQTLADARAYVLALPPGIRHQDDWQRTAELLVAAAESGAGIDVEQATFQLERALLFHGLLARG